MEPSLLAKVIGTLWWFFTTPLGIVFAILLALKIVIIIAGKRVDRVNEKLGYDKIPTKFSPSMFGLGMLVTVLGILYFQ